MRLRRLMFLAMHGADEPGPWERHAEQTAHRLLGESGRQPGAFVVEGDEPGVPHLAACAVGTMEDRLAAPLHPEGRFGFVFGVCTDPLYRGRGYSRTTTEALLDWYGVFELSDGCAHAAHADTAHFGAGTDTAIVISTGSEPSLR